MGGHTQPVWQCMIVRRLEESRPCSDALFLQPEKPPDEVAMLLHHSKATLVKYRLLRVLAENHLYCSGVAREQFSLGLIAVA